MNWMLILMLIGMPQVANARMKVHMGTLAAVKDNVEELEKQRGQETSPEAPEMIRALPFEEGGKPIVFPNPFLPAKGHRTIKFARLPSGSTVRIFTVSLEFVLELRDEDYNGFIEWDARDQNGEDVASGVYAACIISGSHPSPLNFVIER